jgi:hypothetical protein
MSKWIAGILATVIGGVAIAFFSGQIDVSKIVKTIHYFKCDGSWSWDSNRSKCVLNVTIPEQRVSVNLDQKINSIEGRIDFYLNEKRLPDKDGHARYEPAPGSVQIVVPVMQGNKLVGSTKEVIFSTNQGEICSLQGMPQATGWMSTMKVDYLLLLDECGVSEDKCTVSLENSGTRVQLKTKEIAAVLAKRC